MNSSRALRTSILPLVATLLAASVAGGAPANFKVDVNVVVVDVVVTGEDGRPVRGLTAADFELTEDGEAQAITDCDEVDAAAGTSYPPGSEEGTGEAADEGLAGRRFVLLFDTVSATPNQLSITKDAARDLVRRTVGPADRVSVLSYGAGLRLHMDFTADVARIEEGIEAVASRGAYRTEDFRGQTSQTVNPHQEISKPPGSKGAWIDPFVEENDPLSLRGRSPGDSISIESQRAAYGRIEERQAAERFQKAIALVGTTLANTPGRKTMVLFSTGGDVLAASGSSPAAYRAMVASLNRANVAVYAVDVGGGSGSTPGDVQAEVGYATGMLGQPTDARNRMRADRRAAMEAVAADTGGLALFGGDLGRRLEEMVASTSHYYMLGYTPDDLARSGFRDVKVKVRVPGARVLARKGYVKAKPYVELTKRERETQVEDAFGAWTGIDEIPLDIRTDFYPDTWKRTTVAMELGLPPAIIAADATGGRFEVVARVFRPSGRKVAERRQLVTLSEVEASRPVRFTSGIPLKPGNYILKAVVRDDVDGRIGTATARFKIPEFPDDAPIVSTPVLLEPLGSSRLVASEGSDRVVSGYVLGGERLAPVAPGALRAEGQTICHFRVMNLQLDPVTAHPRLIVSYTMTRGEELVLRQVVHYRIEGEVDPEIGAPVHVAIPLDKLTPGAHRLEVLAFDVLASKAVRAEVDFTVAAP